jgi:hypothetical protein
MNPVKQQWAVFGEALKKKLPIGKIKFWIGSLALAAGLAATDAWARKEPLLNVSQGQLPTDTGSDGATKFAIEENKELGGPALKVVFAAGDSVGDRIAKVSNWKPFTALEFTAFNPGPANVNLIFSVRHKRTTSYQTRVDMPVALKPGRNEIRIGIDEMLNVNGSAPDLANVVRWYFAAEAGQAPTLYLGDLWLVGDDASTAPVTAPATGVPASALYRIKGKIGDMTVDLTATPEGLATAPTSTAAKAPADDPGRLARIRAAKMPPVAQPVLFNTPEADAVLAALEVFPPDNPWNLLVTDWPLHPNSKAMVASIGNDKPLRGNTDMGFVLVPPDQKRVEVKIVDYPGESDKGPFPVPDNTPIEGWPVSYQGDEKLRGLSLDDVQRNKLNEDADRHALVVDPVNRMLYEFYHAKKTATGWEAAQASIFDLKSNALRPTGWTSSDAAGLPVFPAVVRYDELKRGVVEHALRVTVRKTRAEFVAPATHYASPHTDPVLPRMGERLRLRQDFDVSGFSPEVRAILTALKRYGMFVADNGIEWAISLAPDERIPALHEELRRVKGMDFEVVTPPQ